MRAQCCFVGTKREPCETVCVGKINHECPFNGAHVFNEIANEYYDQMTEKEKQYSKMNYLR